MLQFPFSFSVSLFLSSTYVQIGLAYNPHLCFIALVKSCPLDHEVNIKYTSILNIQSSGLLRLPLQAIIILVTTQALTQALIQKLQ